MVGRARSCEPPDPKSGVLPTELLPYILRGAGWLRSNSFGFSVRCNDHICHCSNLLYISNIEEEVGFQPTRRDDYRPNGFQVRPLQALEYSSIFVENIRIELISADS